MKEEEQLQIMVCNWVKTNTDLPFIHIANQRQCNPTRGKILKQMGVMPGVFDIFIPREFIDQFKFHGIPQAECYNGLFLELKTSRGKLSKLQLEFRKMIEREGFKTEVAYGFEEAINFIKKFYSL